MTLSYFYINEVCLNFNSPASVTKCLDKKKHCKRERVYLADSYRLVGGEATMEEDLKQVITASTGRRPQGPQAQQYQLAFSTPVQPGPSNHRDVHAFSPPQANLMQTAPL